MGTGANGCASNISQEDAETVAKYVSDVKKIILHEKIFWFLHWQYHLLPVTIILQKKKKKQRSNL